ncbi:MAG: HAD-IIIC family phosphatase [Lachnospiraceae bacterium]|nr:HAD-IIIC family phosphatase [Lachnospiraceae bacterium]
MEELKYPFNSDNLIRRKKQLKKLLLKKTDLTPLKIAILGGATTNDIMKMMELFLLDQGIRPEFYESEYNRFYEDAMFPNPELEAFKPDIIFICTFNKNIRRYPDISDTPEIVEEKLENEYLRFENMWKRISSVYKCPVIQNNFEYPYYRLLGNKDASDPRGRVNFISRLNMRFNSYADSTDNFYINDINYISASYGLKEWSDPFYWHMYKYALAVPAIPDFSFNVSNIIKSLMGKNKKVLMLDMDNTLWGGVIGDDGPDNIETGQETPIGQTYSEFQTYIRALGQLGVLLTLNSKNDEETALAGLKRDDSVLKPEDFIYKKINWLPKSENLINTAKELNLLPESFVFVDDNPAEREIVRSNVPGTAVPEIGDRPENYIGIIDKSGFFEATNLSKDDMTRNEMYKANAKRLESLNTFTDYGEYLRSLEMKGEIQEFIPAYMSRISQLTNKSNQFNLTTRRYTQSEIEKVAATGEYITLYGRLTDKFGDNGVVSVVIGHVTGDECHIDLWIMSCRVLKRDMEFAMMDELVKKCAERKIKTIIGYYYPTAKNAMVKEFYALQGFEKISEDEGGNTVWHFDINENYVNKNRYIDICNGV